MVSAPSRAVRLPPLGYIYEGRYWAKPNLPSLLIRATGGSEESDLFRPAGRGGSRTVLRPKSLKPSAAVTSLMWYILVAAGLLVILLAKRKARRRRAPSRFPISESVVVGALADLSAIGTDYDDNFSSNHFVVSQHATYALRTHTVTEGPIHVVIGHSDYTEAEIIEWWAATNAWDTGNMIAQEFRKRKLRHVGTFPGLDTEEVLNNGNIVKTPCKFMVQEDHTMQLIAINESGATLTTGSIIKTQGNVWARAT